MLRTEARIDLNAIQHNVRTLRAGTAAELMAVVKADGYGHGLLPSARAALAGGASWLGVAYCEEALALRAAGITVPVLAWLVVPGEDLSTAVAAGIDLSAAAPWAVAEIVAAARSAGATARIHLKIDTGLGRSGATAADWAELVSAAAGRDELEIVGIWSHFSYADVPDHPTNVRQLDAFHAALEVAKDLGVVPQLRHLANSAATLTLPAAHFDLVRPGLAVYGLTPVPPEPFGLQPAMTLRSHIALAKRVPAGSGVSYGHAYRTERETGLALVPLGYADGVPRSAGNTAEVWLAGRRRKIAGRVCMDQFVLDVGDDPVVAGEEVVLFGPGQQGEPSAQDWAEAVGTISYEIVSRVGLRVPRSYVGGRPPTDPPAGRPA